VRCIRETSVFVVFLAWPGLAWQNRTVLFVCLQTGIDTLVPVGLRNRVKADYASETCLNSKKDMSVGQFRQFSVLVQRASTDLAENTFMCR
jgi:hypothetical protein